MESLKKVISLSQAAKMTGYHQDYLGSLIRKGEIKGKKMGRIWFTTEEEIRGYMFRQKVRHKRSSIWEFFGRRRFVRRIFLFGLLITLIGFPIIVHFSNQRKLGSIEPRVANTALTAEAEVMTEKKP